MGVDMLIWESLAKVKHHLSIYLKNAPEKEATYLATLLEIITHAETNILKALDEYKSLILHVNQWYSQNDFEQVDMEQSLTLLHETNQFLRALETTCRGLFWPFSTQVPITLYDDIEALLALSLVKEQALIKQRKQDQQSPHSITTSDGLYHLLEKGINTLQTKKTALAEQKDANMKIVFQFKQLQNCLSLPNKESMENFWQQYSAPETFESLMTLLLIYSEEEKKAWLLTHAFYRTDFNCDTNALGLFHKNVSSLYLYGTKKFFGKTLTPELLSDRLTNSIKLFYQKVVEQEQQTEDETQWLTELETIIDECQLDPTLHELIIFQELMNEQQQNYPLSFSKPNKALNTLTLLAKTTSQQQANMVKKVRRDLCELLTCIKDLQQNLNEYTQAQQLLFQQIQTIRTLADTQKFNQSEMDKTELLELLDKYQSELEQNFIQQLPENLQVEIEQSNGASIEKFQIFLQEKSEKVEEILITFNQAGEAERKLALQALHLFIQQKQGIWEYILRFFSRSYCQCMVNIETALMMNEKSSLEKVDTITEQLEKARSNGGYFVRQRLTLFSTHHPQGIFQPCKELEESFMPPAQCQLL